MTDFSLFNGGYSKDAAVGDSFDHAGELAVGVINSSNGKQQCAYLSREEVCRLTLHLIKTLQPKAEPWHGNMFEGSLGYKISELIHAANGNRHCDIGVGVRVMNPKARETLINALIGVES